MTYVSGSHMTNGVTKTRPSLASTVNRATSERNAKEHDALVALSRLVEQRKAGLTTLSRQRSAEADARKARALAKVEELKQRLRELSRYGMYPRLMAQQAAQIARELKAAAKDYAVAARASGDVGSLAAAVVPVADGAATDATATAADSKTDPADGASTVTEPVAASKDRQAAGSLGADGSHAAPGAGSESDDDRDPVVRDTRDATSAGFDKSIEASDALRRFRELARDLKSTIERAVRLLKKQDADDKDAEQATRAEDDLRDTLDDLGKAMREEIAAAGDASNGSGAAIPALVDLAV